MLVAAVPTLGIQSRTITMNEIVIMVSKVLPTDYRNRHKILITEKGLLSMQEGQASCIVEH